MQGPSLGTFTPTTAVPTIATEAAVTFPPATTPTMLSVDSPPYTPTAPQVSLDDDDEFMSTYTFVEFPLPTVIAEGVPPITTGIAQPTAIPTAPCLVQPGAQFVRRRMARSSEEYES